MSKNREKDSKMAANRLLILCETLITNMVMIPVENRATFHSYDYTAEETETIQEIKQEINKSELYWDIINRKVNVSTRMLQIYRICAVLLYLDEVRDEEERVKAFRMIQKLLEKKMVIQDDVVQEFLILCVDLRTIILAIRFESDSLEDAEQEFFQEFPIDSYVNLDEETIQFFHQQLDSNSRAIQESVKDDALSIDILLESFEQDLSHLIANIMIDLNDQMVKKKQENRRVSAALHLSPLKKKPALAIQRDGTPKKHSFQFAPPVDESPVKVNSPVKVKSPTKIPMPRMISFKPTSPSAKAIQPETSPSKSKKIMIERSGKEKKMDARLRYHCLMSYHTRPEQKGHYPIEWATLKKPNLTDLKFEYHRLLDKVKKARVVRKTPKKRHHFQMLSSYDSPMV